MSALINAYLNNALSFNIFYRQIREKLLNANRVCWLWCPSMHLGNNICKLLKAFRKSIIALENTNPPITKKSTGCRPVWNVCYVIYVKHIVGFVTWALWHHDNRQVSMVVADGLLPILWQDICNNHDDVTCWRHPMEAFSALLALCAGNSPVTGEFPSQRPVTRSFGVFFDLRLNKGLRKQSWSWWFEAPTRSSWRHCNVYQECWLQRTPVGQVTSCTNVKSSSTLQ